MNKPRLILICGRPGSGKSTLAKNLAKEIRAVLIDKDCVDEAFSPNDRGPLYQATIQPAAYQTLLNLAIPNLELGHTVILDAPWTHNFFYYPDLGPRVLNLAKKSGSQLFVFEIELPAEEVKVRLQKRGFKRDEPKLTEEGWEEFVTRHRIGEKNPLPHIAIDGRLSAEECLKTALGVILSEREGSR